MLAFVDELALGFIGGTDEVFPVLRRSSACTSMPVTSEDLSAMITKTGYIQCRKATDPFQGGFFQEENSYTATLNIRRRRSYGFAAEIEETLHSA